MRYTPFADLAWTGGEGRVTAGGLLGRAAHASLRIPHPSVSEAHALLTLRDHVFRLQALRGPLRVGDLEYQEIPLKDGLEVRLSDAVVLTVIRAVVPSVSLAFMSEGATCCVPRLPCSIVRRSEAKGCDPDAELAAFAVVCERSAHSLLSLHEDADGLWCQLDAGPMTKLQLPAEWEIDGRSVRLGTVPLQITPHTAGAAPKPLRISARYDSVHIWSGSTPSPIIVTGIPARIITEVALLGSGPVGWEIVAREIWPREDERLPLRDKWDKALQRLRKTLRSSGVRADLLRIDRHGNVELSLYVSDALSIDTGD